MLSSQYSLQHICHLQCQTPTTILGSNQPTVQVTTDCTTSNCVVFILYLTLSAQFTIHCRADSIMALISFVLADIKHSCCACNRYSMCTLCRSARSVTSSCQQVNSDQYALRHPAALSSCGQYKCHVLCSACHAHALLNSRQVRLTNTDPQLLSQA